MRLKDKWSTHLMIPEKMHIALAINLDTSVDWRLIVFWVAFLEFYQDQTKAAIENGENEFKKLEKENGRATEHELSLSKKKRPGKTAFSIKKTAVRSQPSNLFFLSFRFMILTFYFYQFFLFQIFKNLYITQLSYHYWNQTQRKLTNCYPATKKGVWQL